MTVTAELLSAARNYLDITWDDADEDTKLTGVLQRGMAYLNHIAGTSLDFSVEDNPRALLFDYARYARENALDEFTKNYSTELNTLHIRETVKAELESEGDSE